MAVVAPERVVAVRNVLPIEQVLHVQACLQTIHAGRKAAEVVADGGVIDDIGGGVEAVRCVPRLASRVASADAPSEAVDGGLAEVVVHPRRG